METPRWIQKEEECNFCWKYNPVSEIIIAEDESYLQVVYECKNTKCRCIKALGYPARFIMRYCSKGHVEQYKKLIEKAWKPDIEAQA